MTTKLYECVEHLMETYGDLPYFPTIDEWICVAEYIDI